GAVCPGLEERGRPGDGQRLVAALVTGDEEDPPGSFTRSVYASVVLCGAQANPTRRTRHMPVKITARPNGPYLVEGDVELYDPTGAKVDTTGKPRVALCRCGHSSSKPMCDGTHS